MLAQRLTRLVDEGMLVKVPYEEHPPRVRVPADRQGPRLLGRARRHVAVGHGLAVARRRAARSSLVDRDDRHVVRPVVVDEQTGEPLDVRHIRVAANRDA